MADVVVEKIVNTVEVQRIVHTVKVAASGLRGEPGPAGPPGSSYTHTQSSAASVWTVNHNLGYYPDVEFITTGGLVFDGHVQHMSVSQCVCTFITAIAGSARCT